MYTFSRNLSRYKNTGIYNTLYKRFYNYEIKYNSNKSEPLISSNDFSNESFKNTIHNDTISILGYGPQGRSQALNLRDNNFNITLGLRKDGNSWNKALKDGWIANTNLFEIDEAAYRGTIVKYLLSDIGQIEQWKNVKDNLHTNDTLYFSHGFGIHYHDYTHINPPDDINVIMISPKCSGNTLRKNFLNKKGFMASYAIYKDYTGNSLDKIIALAFSIGCNHIFKTTFEKEVLSDLTGERCILMGMIQAAFSAQYKVLRNNGHSPLEAYNETIEEALKSLYPLIDDKGMEWLYRNCSTTAQRGALDWSKKFEEKITPLIEECYESVKNKTELERLIECNKDSNYSDKLNKELDELSNQELWNIKKQLENIKQHRKLNTWSGFNL